MKHESYKIWDGGEFVGHGTPETNETWGTWEHVGHKAREKENTLGTDSIDSFKLVSNFSFLNCYQHK